MGSSWQIAGCLLGSWWPSCCRSSPCTCHHRAAWVHWTGHQSHFCITLLAGSSPAFSTWHAGSWTIPREAQKRKIICVYLSNLWSLLKDLQNVFFLENMKCAHIKVFFIKALTLIWFDQKWSPFFNWAPPTSNQREEHRANTNDTDITVLVLYTQGPSVLKTDKNHTCRKLLWLNG